MRATMPWGNVAVVALQLIALCVSSASSDDQQAPMLSGESRSYCGPNFAAWQDSMEFQPSSRVNSSQQLSALRNLMRVHNIFAYLVPSSDEHMNEYVHKHSERLRWLSGFSGSSGMAVITPIHAVLWTDARFTDQADEQLDCGWSLARDVPGAPGPVEWLLDNVASGSRVGADPGVMLYTEWEKWKKELMYHNQIKMIETRNLVDQLWTERNGRPPPSKNFVMVQKYENAGKIWFNKVNELRKLMTQRGVDGLVLTALDEIAWVLNIRGRDLPHAPLVTAFLFISQSSVQLFVNRDKITPQVSQHLRTDNCEKMYCVKLRDYESVWVDLPFLTQSKGPSKGIIWFSNHERLGASKKIVDLIDDPRRRHMEASPVIAMKTVKNELERDAMRRAHVHDGAAMCDFLAHLETLILDGADWNETKVAYEADHFRSEQRGFWMSAFPTHAGYGPHGALPHYVATPKSAHPIGFDSTLVIDSGGQYENGTTDVTRTLHFGVPERAHIEAYTRVLQGLIEVSSAKVPVAMNAHAVDILGRAAVWDAGENYPHASGHGVGAALSVHEEPLSIAYYGEDVVRFQPGSFFTAEPGSYKKGEFGVRLENVLEVVPIEMDDNANKFVAFRTATLVPFESKLIDVEMLSPKQRHWLNEYNARVREEVGEELKHQMRMKGFYWMMNHTLYVPEHCCPRASSATSAVPVAGMLASLLLPFLLH